MIYSFKESFIKPYFTNKFMFQFLVHLCLVLEHVFVSIVANTLSIREFYGARLELPVSQNALYFSDKAQITLWRFLNLIQKDMSLYNYVLVYSEKGKE